MRFRYSRWDDTQDPFGPDLAAADLLEELSEDVLGGAGIEGAMQRMIREGMRGRFNGLDSLRDRLRRSRAQEQGALDLTGPLEDIKERLDEILDRERSALSFRADDDARMRETFLGSLPPDAAGQVRELTDYRFADQESQRMFDELVESIREQVMGAYLRGAAEGLRSMTAEDLSRLRDMLADLNDMIERRERGEPYDFHAFMDRYADLVPGDPRTLDELLEQMARRMAAMSRLIASLPPEQRAELEALAEQVMQDMDLAFEMSRLGANLQTTFAQLPWDEPALGGGGDPQALSTTVDALERLHDYEDLERSMTGDYAGAALDDVD
ncbi:MAG: hypothetical protein H0W82_03930, partial [Actinobacteria bacterium]|nr:hypothetical protein [Actinomycetota bacterium]